MLSKRLYYYIGIFNNRVFGGYLVFPQKDKYREYIEKYGKK